MKITRREAIIDIVLLSLSGIFLDGCGKKRSEVLLKNPDKRVTDYPGYVVQVYGEDPYRITKKAIDLLGGMKTFVKKGEKVLIKPNIGFNRPSYFGSDTNPMVVKAVAEEVLKVGPSQVIVADYTLYNPKSCYKRSGIYDALRGLDVEVKYVSQFDFVKVDIGGKFIKEWEIYRYFLDVDRVINVPVLKQHSLAGLSMAMKNLMGVIGGKRSYFHRDLSNALADLNSFLHPTLNILDCYRVIVKNGPQGGGIKDTVLKKSVIAGVDVLSVDFYGALLMGYGGNLPGYVIEGKRRNLGELDRELKTVEI